MRRSLVLTNEAARHPFRQTLPPPRGDAPPVPVPASDTTLFVMTFIAAFLAFSAFLA